MKEKEMISPYKIIRKKGKNQEKPKLKIKRKRSEPETFWPKSDFNPFEMDPRAWEPIFFRKIK